MIRTKCSAVVAFLLFGTHAYADTLSVKNGNLPDVFTQFAAVNEVNFTATGVPNGCIHHTYMEDIDRVAWNIENEYPYTTYSLPKRARHLNRDFGNTNPKYSYLPRARPHMVAVTAQTKPETGLLNQDCSWMAVQVRGPRDLVVPMDRWPKDGVLATKRIAHQRYAKQFLNHRTVPENAVNQYTLNPEKTMVYVVLESEKGQILESAAQWASYKLTNYLNTRVRPIDRVSLMSLWTPNVRWTEVTEFGFSGDTVMPSTYYPSSRRQDPKIVQQLKDNVKKADLFGYMVNKEQSAVLIRAAVLSSDQISRFVYPTRVSQFQGIDSKHELQKLWAKVVKDFSADGLENALSDMVTGARKNLPKNLKLHVAVVYADDFAKGVNPNPFYKLTAEQQAEVMRLYPYLLE